MSPGRVIARLLAVVALLLLLGAGLVWWLMSTESGSRRLVAFVLGKTPAGLEIAEVRGSIGRQLHLNGIQYRSGALSAEIDSAMLDLRLSQVVRGKLILEQVRVAGMRVVMADSVPADTAGTARARSESPRPPIPVEVVSGVISAFQLDAPGGVSLRDGRLTFSGNLDQYRFDLLATVFVPQVDTTRIHAGGTGTLESIRLDSTSSAEMLGGRIIPVGTVGWYPSLKWDLSVAVDSVEPSRILPSPRSFPGRVSLQATTVGAIDSAGPNGEATLDSISGILRGRPISGSATVRFRTLVLEHVTTDLRWGPARIRSEGFVGDTLALRYDAEVSDIGGILRGGSGRVHFTGTASGVPAHPRVLADIHGSGLRVGGFRAREVQGNGDVTVSPRGQVELRLQADSATLAARPLGRVVVSAEGRLDAHEVRLVAARPDDTTTVRLAGGLAGPTWRGRIDSLSVLSPVDKWRLVDPAALVVSPSLIRFDTLCVVSNSGAGFGCAAAEYRGPAQWDVVATADSLRLDLFPVPQPVTGAVTGRLEAHNTSTGLEATVTASVADSGRDTGKLEGTVTMPGYRLGRSLTRQPFESGMRARFERPDLVAPLVRADSLRGILAADLRGSGMASAPAIAGEVRVDSAVAWFRGKHQVSGSAVLLPRVTIAIESRRMDGEVRLSARNLEGEKFVADSVVATLVADAGGMHATVGTTIRASGGDSVAGLRAELSLPGYRHLRMPPGTQEMAFKVEARAPDLSFVGSLFPAVDSLRGAGHLAMEGSGRIGLPSVKGTLRIADAVARLSTGTEARGGLDGDLDLTVTETGIMRGHLRVVPQDVRLAASPGDTVSEVRVRGGVLDVQADSGGVRAALDASLASDSDSAVAVVEMRAALPDYRRVGSSLRTERLEATIKGRVDDFGFLPAFVAAIDSASGTMTFDASLAGTVGDSRMAGEADVKDVTLRFPEVGITVVAINLTARGNETGDIAVHGTAKSGGGQLEIEGTTPARPSPGRVGLLTVQGEDFLAANNDQVRALISPDLQVTLAGDTLAIRGHVDVPHARIDLAELPEAAVRPSDDVVVVEEGGAPRRERPVIANVRVTLGDDVTFQGFNFNAELAGGLTLLDVPGRPTRAIGTLVIEEGHYRSYGQDLTVTNGEVRFNGPIDNPGLNIRAQRVVNDSITVGIAMGGWLKEPDVRLYSSQAMSQTQTLSYIVTGGPVGGSGSSGNLVNKALSALGIGGSSQVINALGEDIGLSSARIETEGDLQDASLVVGKFLSPRVYVSYGVGLFDPVSTLRLRYILSSKFTLLAEAGRETSADAVVRVKSKP